MHEQGNEGAWQLLGCCGWLGWGRCAWVLNYSQPFVSGESIPPSDWGYKYIGLVPDNNIAEIDLQQKKTSFKNILYHQRFHQLH